MRPANGVMARDLGANLQDKRVFRVSFTLFIPWIFIQTIGSFPDVSKAVCKLKSTMNFVFRGELG
jgi:hypothetical protein